jgi:hypothetical protein
MLSFWFKQFKSFKPSPSSPRRGGGKRWRLERSVAVEPSEAIERIEQFLMRSNTPVLQHSNSGAMAFAEMKIKSPSVPLCQRGKFYYAYIYSLNFAEPVPLFEKEGPGEIFP